MWEPRQRSVVGCLWAVLAFLASVVAAGIWAWWELTTLVKG